MDIITSTMQCDAAGCDNEVAVDHAEGIDLYTVNVAIALCADACGWQVGTPYHRDDSLDYCPAHRG